MTDTSQRAGFMRRYKTALVAGGFLLPALSLLIAFVYVPMATTLRISFYQWNMVSPNQKWVGLANYQEIIGSRELWVGLWNTGVYVVLLLILNLAIPYVCAFILSRLIPNRQAFYKAAIFLPSVLSLAVASVIFLWIFNPLTGPVNTILSAWGLTPPNWLKSKGWVMLALGIITAWKCFGYNFIVLMAGMTAVPLEIIEAAKLDGASNWKIFRKIIIPLTSSTALYVFVMTIVMGSQYMFVPIQMLTDGGPDQGSSNVIFLVYQFAFNFFLTGKAAAFSVLILILFAGFIILQGKVLEKGVHYEN